MILRLLWPAARSSRLTIFLILVCISRTSLNWTSDWRRARVISFKQSFNAFSSMIVALLICWIARDILPPNSANTIFLLIWFDWVLRNQIRWFLGIRFSPERGVTKTELFYSLVCCRFIFWRKPNDVVSPFLIYIFLEFRFKKYFIYIFKLF